MAIEVNDKYEQLNKSMNEDCGNLSNVESLLYKFESIYNKGDVLLCSVDCKCNANMALFGSDRVNSTFVDAQSGAYAA